MEYTQTSGISGNWVKKEELKNGQTAKITNEVTRQPSNFKNEDGSPQMQDVGKVMFDGFKEALNVSFLRGNALEPRGTGTRIIAQIVNDKTPNWGAGFAREVRNKYP